MAKRLFDFFVSLILILLLFPVFVVVGIWVISDSRGGMFFVQERMGQKGKSFRLFKFRTMLVSVSQSSPITTKNDSRITGAGNVLRRYKLDELPQLLNVLIGDMSLVGPRPEIPRYASYYTGRYEAVLSVKPGITDTASLEFFDESELLKGENPEKIYTDQILPRKLELALQYVQQQSFIRDLSILTKTVIKVVSV